MNGDKPQAPDEGSWQFKSETANTTAPQPTQETVSNQATEVPAPTNPVASTPAAVEPTPAPTEETPVSLPEQNPAPVVNQDAIPNQVIAEEGDSLDEPAATEVSWSASEFIAHEKSPLWYLILAGLAIVLVAAVYFLFHDMVAAFAIIFVAIIFGFLAAHKPRVLAYRIGPEGLSIDKKMYSFGDFKSFGVVNEGAFSSITFMPMKRFMPSLSIYYPPEEEETIVDALSNYLPFAPVTHDLVDRLMHRIRL
jgi:hypothetical protein